MSSLPLVSLAIAVPALVLGWFAVAGVRALRRRIRIRRRISPLSAMMEPETGNDELSSMPVRERPESARNTLVARLNDRYPLAGGVRTTLFAGAAALLAFASVLPISIFFGLPSHWAFPVAVAVGGAVGWNIGSMMEANKRNEFSARFLVALEDYYRMVRYGIGGNQALHSTAAAAQEPVKSSLRHIVLDAEVGVPIGAAMDLEARRIRSAELSMLAAVVSTHAATGGNLSEAVGNLASMARERLDNRTRMKASTAESRITMIVLSLVPFAAVGLQAVTQPEMIDVLRGEARHLLGIGISLILAGLALSWMIIRSVQK